MNAEKTTNQMRRVFFAIQLNEYTVKCLAEVQSYIRPLVKKGRFTDPVNFHLTLQFVGEIPDEKISQLMIHQPNGPVLSRPLTLKVEGLGSFEKRRRHILWAGLESNETLSELTGWLRNHLAEKGFANHTPFHPHITLARECVFIDAAARSAFDRMKVALPAVSAEKYVLMESRRIEGRLRYLPLMVFPLSQLPNHHS
ncbi:RNA 2',3'-cyclic phosphodiesterase [Anoxynatronum buryatiense]|uniref:RNA 2',3'-cyclic phosphodiesterase n=1 Tax=Anoxynatronum buryatiense TaxID=489973 RepID=A0AA46AHF2_9CLOT|nr:RNA 2',3'-cyclic phosphodiesterase [Anoxynatronum buryatiense]SMP39222.1 2'-5' RNA ligase [Anoxynatronum buryatiense]